MYLCLHNNYVLKIWDVDHQVGYKPLIHYTQYTIYIYIYTIYYIIYLQFERQSWFWNILMAAWCASTDLQLCFTCISQVIIMVLCPVSIYMFKKECMKFGANPRNSHKNNYWDGGGKVYDESQEAELLGLEKAILNIKSLKEYWKGKKSYIFCFTEDQIRRPFLGSGLSCNQRTVCVYRALWNGRGVSILEWVTQGECLWGRDIWFSCTAPRSVVLNVTLICRTDYVLIIQQAFHAICDPALPLFSSHTLPSLLPTLVSPYCTLKAQHKPPSSLNPPSTLASSSFPHQTLSHCDH